MSPGVNESRRQWVQASISPDFNESRLQWVQAKATLSTVIEQDPENFGAYINLAAAEIDLGELIEAMAHVNKAIEFAPDVGRAYLVKAQVFTTMARHQDAYNALLKAQTLDTTDAQIQAKLGNAAWKLRKDEAALQHFRSAVALNSEDQMSYLNIAKLCILLDRPADDPTKTEEGLSKAVDQLTALEVPLSLLRLDVCDIVGALSPDALRAAFPNGSFPSTEEAIRKLQKCGNSDGVKKLVAKWAYPAAASTKTADLVANVCEYVQRSDLGDRAAGQALRDVMERFFEEVNERTRGLYPEGKNVVPNLP